MPLLDRVVVRLCDCVQTPGQDTGVHLWKIGQGAGPCWCEWCRNPLLIRPASRLPTHASLALSLHTQCPAVPEGTQPTSLTTTPLSQKTAAPLHSDRPPWTCQPAFAPGPLHSLFPRLWSCLRDLGTSSSFCSFLWPDVSVWVRPSSTTLFLPLVMLFHYFKNFLPSSYLV